MTIKRKAEWIDALRSGEFKQTTGSLKAVSMDGGSVGHCCLGVYAEICEIPWNGDDAVPNYAFPTAESTIPHIAVMLLPSAWSLEQGLNPNLVRRLANMNDGSADMRPHTFAEIADYLEGLTDEDEA